MPKSISPVMKFELRYLRRRWHAETRVAGVVCEVNEGSDLIRLSDGVVVRQPETIVGHKGIRHGVPAKRIAVH